MAKKPPLERDEAFRVLTDLGWSDIKIGRAFGISDAAIYHWRRKHGIVRTNERKTVDNDAALKLYHQGALDAEIASQLGVTKSGVTKWRKRRGLPRNSVPVLLTKDQFRDIDRMLKAGGSAPAISAAIGCSLNTVLSRRKRLSSPFLRPSGITDQAQRSRMSKDPEVLVRIKTAIGEKVPDHIRDHAALDLYGDVYDGLVSTEAIEAVARKYRSSAYEMCGSAYEHSRLDAENEDGARLLDTIPDEKWEESFDFEDV